MDIRAIIGDALTRAAIIFALVMVALILTLTGLGFALAAIYISLLPSLGAGAAAAVIALGAFIIAALLLLAFRLSLRRGGGGRAPVTEPAAASPGGDAFAAAEDAAAWVTRYPKRSLLLALLAGAVVGASPGLRARADRLFDAFTRG